MTDDYWGFINPLNERFLFLFSAKPCFLVYPNNINFSKAQCSSDSFPEMTESNAGATTATTALQELRRRLAVEVGSAPALETPYITRSKKAGERSHCIGFPLISI